MKKQEINDKLKQAHRAFTLFIDSLTDEEFLVSYGGKWTPAQQLDHIYISVKPLTRALFLPDFVLRLLFGKANKSSRTYEELVEKYKKR